jgi:putative ABC transport system ATP-binding protein
MSALIRVQDLCHYYGKGKLRKKILYDINAEVFPGEIVILTGPSGSGKTTLLTLMGALRSAQEGSLEVLGEQLREAKPKKLESIRREIGYIFQAHNLLEALTVRQNVEMALYLHPEWKKPAAKKHAIEMLAAVGLADHVDKFASELSGGQKQRVAIARALVSHPKIVLADEPTASLDKHSGREVVELMRKLARDQQVAVIIVTHDNRILDVADRIIHLEDGYIQSGSEVIAANTTQMLKMMERHNPDSMRYIAAYANGLARVANIDGHISEHEIEEMRRILLHEITDLEPPEVELALEMALSNIRVESVTNDIDFTAEQKQHFINSLKSVAAADGDFNDIEKQEIEKIANELGLSSN